MDLSNENLLRMVKEVEFFRQFDKDPIFRELAESLKNKSAVKSDTKTTSNSLGLIPNLDEDKNMKVFNAKMLE